MEEWTRRQKKDKTERVTGLGRRTREKIVKWNQMTALRLQTGEETSDVLGLPSGERKEGKEVIGKKKEGQEGKKGEEVRKKWIKEDDEGMKTERKKETKELVSWRFEPTQSLRIISGLKEGRQKKKVGRKKEELVN